LGTDALEFRLNDAAATALLTDAVGLAKVKQITPRTLLDSRQLGPGPAAC
jgi:hypothetical protein